MSYATARDLLLWFGARELTEVAVPDDLAPIPAELLRLSIEEGQLANFTSEAIATAEQTLLRIQAVLDEGSRLLDSYLAGRYQLPLPVAVVASSPLPRACSVLALALLYDDLLPETVAQRQRHVLTWLQDLAAGRVHLTADLTQPTPACFVQQSTAGSPSYTTGARVFDDKTLRGFA